MAYGRRMFCVLPICRMCPVKGAGAPRRVGETHLGRVRVGFTHPTFSDMNGVLGPSWVNYVLEAVQRMVSCVYGCLSARMVGIFNRDQQFGSDDYRT